MKNKVIVFLILLLIVITGCDKLKGKDNNINGKEENISLMEFDKFKDIVIDKVIQIDYTRFTEGGRDDKIITNQEEIQSIYNNLKKLTVVKETTMACEDNTKLYTFHMNDGNKEEVELECNWVVLGNRRYEVR